MARKNRILEKVRIEKIASEGKCIAHVNGKAVFVEDTAPGDLVDIKIRKKRKQFEEGFPIHFHEFSSLRREPFCEHFDYCGGCKWQHLPYEEQVKAKQEQVVSAFRHLGGLEASVVSAIIPCEQEKLYRNKLEYTFSAKKWLTPEEIKTEKILEKHALGFHIRGHFDKVLHVEKCHLMDDFHNTVRNAMHKFATENDISYYDIKEQTGFLRNLIIRNTDLGHWMVLLQVGEKKEELIQKCMEFIRSSFPEITSLYYVINEKKNDTFTDLEPVLFHGKPYMEEKMEELIFRIGPKSFFQTNSRQATKLYQKVREFCADLNGKRVYDLYTGTGTIAQFLAKDAKEVIGIEYVPEAIEDAIKNAELNKLNNLKFFAGDMKDMLKPDFMEEHGQPDIVVCDPPRAGMHADVCSLLKDCGAERIVYVSCNPATQVRDIKILEENYNLEEINAFDLFPQTHHVENIALLKRRLNEN